MNRFAKSPPRRLRAAIWLVVSGVLAFALPAPLAGAQPDCSKYPSTCPPPAVQGHVTIKIEPHRGPPGTSVQFEVCGQAPGTPVQVTFADQTVAEGVAGEDGCFRGRFTVASVDPGNYDVCGVSAAGTACTQFVVSGQGQRGASESALGKTGFRALLWLTVALILLVLGRSLVQAARSRRRARV